MRALRAYTRTRVYVFLAGNHDHTLEAVFFMSKNDSKVLYNLFFRRENTGLVMTEMCWKLHQDRIIGSTETVYASYLM